MEITAANLDILFRAAALNFQGAVGMTQTVYNEIATTIPVSTRQITQAWLDRIPQLRKWKGNRVINNAVAHARTVTCEPFEDTLALNKWDIIDEQLALFSQAVGMLGQAAAKHPDNLLWEFIKIAAAATTLGYDSVPVYSTAHPLLGGAAGGLPPGAPATQSNLLLNNALTYTNYVNALAKMKAYVGADGAPMGVVPNILMVPPALEPTAKLIIEADFLPSAAGTAPQSNPYKNSTKILVNQWASLWPNNWWLLDTNNIVKPFANYELTPATFTYLTNPQDANVFLAAEYLYGVERRAAVSETVWWLSLAATSEAAYIPA